MTVINLQFTWVACDFTDLFHQGLIDPKGVYKPLVSLNTVTVCTLCIQVDEVGVVVLCQGGVAEEEEGEEALDQAEVWINFVNACALEL